MGFQRKASALHSDVQRAYMIAYEDEKSMKEVKDAAQLHSLVKEAFNHFTTRPGQPFTRVPLNFSVDPITQYFKHHILTLASTVSDRYASGIRLTDFEIFLAIAPVIASCIFTHCVRYGRPGQSKSIVLITKLIGV